MAREKKLVHQVQMTDGKRSIIQQLLQEYNIQSAEDIQSVYDTLELPKKSVRIPSKKQGIFLKKGGTC